MSIVPFVLLDATAVVPSYAHSGDAGADLVSNEAVVIKRGGGRAPVATGIAVSIPAGYAGLVVPRSGLALRHGVTCLNTPGVIDSGYTGEVKVVLINHDPETDFEISKGDRIAQLLLVAVEQAAFVQAERLEDSDRGTGGFGSSGR